MNLELNSGFDVGLSFAEWNIGDIISHSKADFSNVLPNDKMRSKLVVIS